MLVLGILGIMGAIALAIIFAVQQSARMTQEAIQPVNAMTNDLATQVAEVLHPTPTILPDPVTIIKDVRSLARLETIQYTVEKVITAETGQGPFGFLFGDQLLLVAHGRVIAGVDMEQMMPGDLSVENGVLTVRMPEAEIFVATLDNDKTFVYNRDTGVLTHGDINLETTARQAAEAEIGKAAVEDGILVQAQQNAENYLYRLLRDLGFPEVIFLHPTPNPNDNGL